MHRELAGCLLEEGLRYVGEAAGGAGSSVDSSKMLRVMHGYYTYQASTKLSSIEKPLGRCVEEDRSSGG
ncbi:MAG: hypothetical protein QXQ29_00175 [Candidatus Bathyarchaeia archaeon]